MIGISIFIYLQSNTLIIKGQSDCYCEKKKLKIVLKTLINYMDSLGI